MARTQKTTGRKPSPPNLVKFPQLCSCLSASLPLSVSLSLSQTLGEDTGEFEGKPIS